MPHKGKFNVTAKGGTIGQKYLDWHISKPFLVLIALNGIGLCIGIHKALFDPQPEYLTLAINIGWIAYNLMILGASMGVAVEDAQTQRYPRVRTSLEAIIIDESAKVHEAHLSEYSQEDVCVSFSAASSFKLGDVVQLVLILNGEKHSFDAVVQKVTGSDQLELTVKLKNSAQERQFNRCTFSRAGMWVVPERKIDDRLWTGFVNLGRLALYGYRSMIEFIPQRIIWLKRFIEWCASFAPSKPV